LKPGSADAYIALGSLDSRLGDDERTIYFIEQGMGLGTPPKEIVNALLLLYAAHGRTEQAKQRAARFGLSYR